MDYYTFFKLKFILDIRRRYGFLQKLLKNRWLTISPKCLFLLSLLKYIIEIITISFSIHYIMETVKLNKDIATAFLYIFFVYLLCNTVYLILINYDAIIFPEDSELIKISPINQNKALILIILYNSMIRIATIYIKRILQFYLPLKIYLGYNSIFEIIVFLFLIYFSFCFSIILLKIKKLNRRKITFLNVLIYVLVCTAIFKLSSIISSILINIFINIPFVEISNNNIEAVDIWIKSGITKLNYYIFNLNSIISRSLLGNLVDLINNLNIVENIFIILTSTTIITIITFIFLKITLAKGDNETKGDVMNIFFAPLNLLLKSLYSKYNNNSIIFLIIKDIKLLERNTNLINTRFKYIFGGYNIWLTFGFLWGFIHTYNNLDYQSSINLFCISMLFFFVIINCQEKIGDLFNYIVSIDGEGMNILIYKLTCFPAKKLLLNKLIVYFLLSTPLYLITFSSFYWMLPLNINEIVVLVINMLLLYILIPTYYLSGKIMYTDYTWSHISYLGNNVGQQALSNMLIRTYEAIYIIFSGIILLIYFLNNNSILMIIGAYLIWFFVSFGFIWFITVKKVDRDIYQQDF